MDKKTNCKMDKKAPQENWKMEKKEPKVNWKMDKKNGKKEEIAPRENLENG